MNSITRTLQRMNRCDWYVFFWCIYQLQEILYPPGIINQGIQVLIMAWAIYEAGIYMLPQRKLPLLLKATSLLLLMYAVYGSIFIVVGSDFYSPTSNYLKSFVNSFLPLYLFYRYSQDNYLDEKRIRIYFLFFLGIIIAQFFHYEELAMQRLRDKGSDRSEITNNMGYYFVSLLPMLFLWYKNRIIQYGALGIIVLFVLMGMKRGAIGITGICTVWLLWDNIKNSTSRKHKYQTIVFGIAMALLAAGVVAYLINNSDYFQERIEDTQKGNSSGRDKIYSNLIDVIVDDNSYVHLFFGRGAYSTIKEIHKLAHNDWLETACNNGLLGIFLMIFLFYAFHKTARDGIATIKPEYKMCMMMLFFASFAKTCFSMSLENMPIYVTMLMAYLTYYTYNPKDVPIFDK